MYENGISTCSSSPSWDAVIPRKGFEAILIAPMSRIDYAVISLSSEKYGT